MIRVRGADLCVESFGERDASPILLVAGTSCSMDWWPPSFCELLAACGHLVVRFDQRDTGRSTFDPPGRPSYALPDLVEDSVGVLDALDIASAHWVGFSQGGWIAQLAALDHPARVRSLVLLSTRPTGHGPADADLPDVADSLLEAWSEAGGEPDWDDAAAVRAYLLDGERSIAGRRFDEAHATSIVDACVARSLQVRSAVANHPAAEQGPRWRERLGEIEAPTLILHGTADPMFPIGNDAALAAAIRGGRLERLPDVGHELPPAVWPRVIADIDRHIGGASVRQ